MSRVRQIEHNWILIVYDIPNSQSTTRKRVIRALKKFGAVQNTESVYYLPDTPKALSLAQKIPGKIFVWQSHLPSEEQAAQLTRDYYQKILEAIEKVQRLINEQLSDVYRDRKGNLLAAGLVDKKARKQRLQYISELFENVKKAAANIGQNFSELKGLEKLVERLRKKIENDGI